MVFLDKTTRIGIWIALISGPALVIIEPKQLGWRLLLLAVFGFGLIGLAVESDWVNQRQEEFSVVQGDLSSSSRSPIRTTLAVISAMMLAVVFGITTWEVEKHSDLELGVKVNSSPATSGSPSVVVKGTPKLPIPAALTPVVQQEIRRKPIQKQPLQPTIIQTQAPYGNLAARCDELGDAIISTANLRMKSQPDPATNRLEYNDWYRLNDGLYFHGPFYPQAAKIHKELADLHIDDPRLDDLLQRHEEYFRERQQFVQQAIDYPPMFHLRIEEIREIGERFKFLATQIPH